MLHKATLFFKLDSNKVRPGFNLCNIKRRSQKIFLKSQSVKQSGSAPYWFFAVWYLDFLVELKIGKNFGGSGYSTTGRKSIGITRSSIYIYR